MKIYSPPDPTLLNPTRDVEDISSEILDLIADMIVTMKEANGLGLAANQVGYPHRIAVVQIDPRTPPMTFINPRVTTRRGKQESYEGCLSLTGDRRRDPPPHDGDGNGQEHHRKGVQAQRPGAPRPGHRARDRPPRWPPLHPETGGPPGIKGRPTRNDLPQQNGIVPTQPPTRAKCNNQVNPARPQPGEAPGESQWKNLKEPGNTP